MIDLGGRAGREPMKIEHPNFILGGIVAFLFAVFVYSHVVKPLQLANQICDLATAIDEECKNDQGACQRDKLPSFKKMLDACKGLTVDWGDDED
jgi:hypothetical protein